MNGTEHCSPCFPATMIFFLPYLREYRPILWRSIKKFLDRVSVFLPVPVLRLHCQNKKKRYTVESSCF